MKNFLRVFCVLLFGLFNINLLSQSIGEIDTLFNSIDKGKNNGDGLNSFALHSVIQPDGKLVLVGDFSRYNNHETIDIVRLDTEGLVDTSFSAYTGLNGRIYNVDIQPDGKILIAGDFTSINGTARRNVARLNSDGSLDQTFTVGTGASTQVRQVLVQNDGKILIAGYFLSYNGNSSRRIARLLVDGTFDSTFTVGNGPNGVIYSTLIQPDGKIIIGGTFTSFNGVPRNRIARLLPDGNLDISFDPGLGANNDVHAIALGPNGNLLVGGSFTSFNNNSVGRIALLDSTGTLVTTASNTFTANGVVNSIQYQPNGKILVGGEFTSFNNTGSIYIRRLNANGTIDTTFQSEITQRGNGDVRHFSVQNDGKILVSGYFKRLTEDKTYFFTRLDSVGKIDYNYNFNTGLNDHVYIMVVQPDDKIVVGGKFSLGNNVPTNSIARFNADGSLDTAFTRNTAISNLNLGFPETVSALCLQPDGKILVGGFFTMYNNTQTNRLVRLNPDGTQDSAFNIGTGANNRVHALALQSDGKIIVGGEFSSFNGHPSNRIVRLNTNGSVDASFNIGDGFNQMVLSLAVQSDDKILVGGSIARFDGLNISRFVRLNITGSLDTTFNNTSGPSSTVYSILIRPDKGIIIAGAFNNIGGVSRSRIAVLDSNGVLDPSFQGPSSLGSQVRSILLQPDMKVIVGGSVNLFGSPNRRNMIRLNRIGVPDPSFNIGEGPDQAVEAMAIQGDKGIVFAGRFTEINGVGKNRFARMYYCQSDTFYDFITACDSYTWIDSITYTSNNNTATHLLQSSLGCDSLVILNLNILSLTPSIVKINDTTLQAFPTGANFQWLDCSNNYAQVLNAYSQTFTPKSNGNYAARILQMPCIDTTDCESITVINEPELSLPDVDIFPIPTEDFINISFPERWGSSEIRIFDLSGKLLYTESGALAPLTIDISHFPQGTYILEIKSKQHQKQQKILKQ